MANTTSSLDGYFKETYGKIEKVVPEFAEIQKRIPFQQQEKVGDSYHFPVFLRRSHGMTFQGPGGSVGTAFALETPVSMVSVDAQVTGTEAVLQEDIAYGVLSRASAQGKQAFGNAMDEVVLGMKETLDFYKEMCLLYGQTSLGIVETETDTATDGTGEVTITAASWAAGLWAGMEGAYVDVYDTTGATLRTTSDAYISSMDLSEGTRRLTLTGTEGQLDNIVATDIIVPRGAQANTATAATFNWFAGIDKILTNTGALFNINAATYALWKANSHSASSAKLTMAKIMAAVTKCVVRGLLEKVTVLVSVYTWTDMMNDLSSLRSFAQDTRSEMTLGTKSLTFFGPNGEVEIVPHAMVKAGEAFVLPFSRAKRVGSSDSTFKLPGVSEQQPRFYQELESSAGIRLRGYWDQAMVITHPAKCAKITGIVNDSLAA